MVSAPLVVRFPAVTATSSVTESLAPSCWIAVAVVGAVGPVARRIERERAVGAGMARLRREVRLTLVNVADGQRAAGGEISGGDRNILGDRVIGAKLLDRGGCRWRCRSSCPTHRA